jgi:hypothetical protein
VCPVSSDGSGLFARTLVDVRLGFVDGAEGTRRGMRLLAISW